MSDAFVDYVMELLGPFGTVTVRTMFGGHGVYLDGLMFAIVSGDSLYLKADDMNRVEFEQAGCEMFAYARQGKRASLNFYRAPADAMESPELMLPWARTAYAAALRSHAKKQVAAQASAEAQAASARTEVRRRAANTPVKKRPARAAIKKTAKRTKQVKSAKFK